MLKEKKKRSSCWGFLNIITRRMLKSTQTLQSASERVPVPSLSNPRHLFFIIQIYTSLVRINVLINSREIRFPDSFVILHKDAVKCRPSVSARSRPVDHDRHLGNSRVWLCHVGSRKLLCSLMNNRHCWYKSIWRDSGRYVHGQGDVLWLLTHPLTNHGSLQWQANWHSFISPTNGETCSSQRKWMLQ